MQRRMSSGHAISQKQSVKQAKLLAWRVLGEDKSRDPPCLLSCLFCCYNVLALRES